MNIELKRILICFSLLLNVVDCINIQTVNKEGRCPDVGEGEVGICANECRNDLSCEGEMKCCSNACGGRICSQPVDERVCHIACPRIYDPVCGSDDQTYSSACMLKFTTCTRNQEFVYQKHDGLCQEIPLDTQKSDDGQGPCESARQKAMGPQKMPMIGAKIPQCDSEGYYRAMQCWGSVGMCWCADRQGNEISEPKRGKLTVEDCIMVRDNLQPSP